MNKKNDIKDRTYYYLMLKTLILEVFDWIKNHMKKIRKYFDL